MQKFGPGIVKRAFKHCSWRGLDWHGDEIYVQVEGKWHSIWRDIDQRGQLINFRLPARRDAKAARTPRQQAQGNARFYQPLTLFADKTPNCAKVLREINLGRDPSDAITHIYKSGPKIGSRPTTRL